MAPESKPRFTPGPWHQHGDSSVRVCNGRHHSEAGCSVIAEAEILEVDRLVAIANTRLIAAAPDLYEALDRLISATHDAAVARGEEPMLVRMARIHATAALAKARGEVA